MVRSRGCTRLKEVTIPNNVTIISSYNREDAFENCTNLTKLTIYGLRNKHLRVSELYEA